MATIYQTDQLYITEVSKHLGATPHRFKAQALASTTPEPGAVLAELVVSTDDEDILDLNVTFGASPYRLTIEDDSDSTSGSVVVAGVEPTSVLQAAPLPDGHQYGSPAGTRLTAAGLAITIYHPDVPTEPFPSLFAMGQTYRLVVSEIT